MSTTQKKSIAQTNHGFNTIPKSVKTISVFVLLLLSCFAFRNLFILSKDMIYGDFSAEYLIPSPLYPIARIPENSFVLKYDAVNKLGKDFAQIYFPAQDISSLANAFNYRTRDPWERPSRYAPLILFICSISICKSTYGYAAFWQLIIQIMIFLWISYIAFKAFDRVRYFLPFLLFANLCLFLTPTGLSWFERGQFSLYEGSSYLLLLLGLWKKNLFWILFSALLAFIKWTSLPLTFVILAVHILNSKNRKELQFSILVTIAYALIFTLLLLPFIKTNIAFINGLFNQELNITPDGLTLATYLPTYVVNALPFLLVILGYVNSRISQNNFTSLIPFFGGSAILLLLYPTHAFEYSVPTLLGFVPCLIFWTQESKSRQHASKAIITSLFLSFIVIASFFHYYFQDNGLTLIIIYLICSVAFIASPAILKKYFQEPLAQETTI